MSQQKIDKPEKCISPWFQYLAIVIVIVLILFAIFEVESINASNMKENLSKNKTRNSKSVGNLLIASSGSSINSDVAVEFETSRSYFVVDLKNGEFKIYSNNWNSYKIRLIQNYIKENNVEAVITGTMNIDTYNRLHSMQVAIITGVSGTVKNAIEMYKDNKLVPVNHSQNNLMKEPYSKRGTRSRNKRAVL